MVTITCHGQSLDTSLDEGKEAFQDMMSAVNNADERGNGISGDIEKTLSKAVSATPNVRSVMSHKFCFRKVPLSNINQERYLFIEGKL